MPLSTLIPGMMPLRARYSGKGSLPETVLWRRVSSNRITPLTNSSTPFAVNSRSRYARRLASLLSTPTDLKRFSQVPLDSSAASSPLPLATMAAAVLERRFRSIEGPGCGRTERKLVILTVLMTALAGGLMPQAAGREHLVGIAPPPVAGGQYLDFV